MLTHFKPFCITNVNENPGVRLFRPLFTAHNNFRYKSSVWVIDKKLNRVLEL